MRVSIFKRNEMDEYFDELLISLDIYTIVLQFYKANLFIYSGLIKVSALSWICSLFRYSCYSWNKLSRRYLSQIKHVSMSIISLEHE